MRNLKVLKARADADASYVTAIGSVLADAQSDPAFAAQMLMPPTENELASQRSPVNPEALHTARVTMIRAIAAAGPLAKRPPHMALAPLPALPVFADLRDEAGIDDSRR